MHEHVIKKLAYLLSDGESLEVKIVQRGVHLGPQFLEINGQRPSPDYQAIDHISVSPNGKRIAFLATLADGAQQVIVDRDQNPAIEQLLSAIYFSEDSKYYSYTARLINQNGQSRYVVITNSQIEHDDEFIFGYDAMIDAPRPKYSSRLQEVEPH